MKADSALADLSAKCAGGTLICLASGPSLTAEDVEKVRIWRESGPGRAVIVANTTFRAAPWADAMYALDRKWWEVHAEEVAQTFKGVPLTSGVVPSKLGPRRLRSPPFRAFGNSGAALVSIGAEVRAKRIVMLGYDCQHTGGMKHWHGDHPAGLGNALSVAKWPAKFRQLARHVRGLEVINASRATALDMFERRSLEELLDP